MRAHILFPREQREKEEIEKYRMERPKIQQQFSDLKVREGGHPGCPQRASLCGWGCWDVPNCALEFTRVKKVLL